MAKETGPAFRWEDGPNGIGFLIFDSPGQKVNTFTHGVLAELDDWMRRLQSRTELAGLVLRSGKPGTFIAGADLEEMLLGAVHQPEGGSAVPRVGQGIFDRLSELPFPTVATIDGACMGGGLEIALACDYRVASTNPATQIGLPETKIGIIPGWGGTQRLPRVVGVSQAVEMITTGEPVDGVRALQVGLVWDAVPPERLIDEAVRLIGLVRQSGEWRTARQRRLQPVGLTEDQAHFLFGVAEGMVRAKTEGHYPAPLVALDVIRRTVNLPMADGLKIEAAAVAPLVTGDICRNLIRIFFATRRLGKDTGVDDRTVTPSAVSRVGVVGAGLMGSGITTAMIRRAVPVTLLDVSDEFVQKGLGRIRANIEGRVAAGRMKPAEALETLARVTPTTKLTLFGELDFVLEAVVENEQTKSELFGKLNALLSPNAIIASNTSTISISRLSRHATRPERFVGMHFFNPADRMPLVEVIRGEQTSDATVATTVALARKIGKTPVVVKDCPGFLVNRILMPYMNEALLLVEEGAALDSIDRAAKAFGMPMGPITLHDVVGLDTALYAGRVVAAAYADRMFEPRILAALVQANRLGQKTGAGFFRYAKGSQKGKPDPALGPILASYCRSGGQFTQQVLMDRMFLPMLIEATRALSEGIARSAEDLDMALILGLGFPQFRGGLLRWADSLGATRVLEMLAPYQSLGKRFEPSGLMRTLAGNGGKYYPQ
jgi:3-hydroxyacyl-CoA dehydrogenase/enoyl-CoA hydratase/3-hydroxybutyryl-CoA epimerase/3-hydroxyacyl-CoA dehydrogenase/enoyl-CoA hydratase/3-hydroxybutyryl-CoA epimerase/enoyl-CoA isomerase